MPQRTIPPKERAEEDRPEKDKDKERAAHGRTEKERRRSPRFNCDGQVEINCLPSEGNILPGKIRDLSLNGCRVDTTLPIDPGVRAEIVLRFKGASFRAVGEVKAIRGRSGAGIEFIHLSVFGKEQLSDMLEELEKMQAFLDKLKASHPQMDLESFSKELEYRKLHAQMLKTRFPFLESIAPEDSVGQGSGENSESKSGLESGSGREEPPMNLVDIFG